MPNEFDEDAEQLELFIRQITAESDRAAVVLAGAKLDTHLFELVRRYLVPCPTSRDDLLDNDGQGSLSSFSARINVTYRLGLIDGGFANVLHLIRKLRNDFAHGLADAKLSDIPHRDRIRSLVNAVRADPLFDRVKGTFFYEKQIHTAEFLTAVTLLGLRLLKATATIKPLDGLAATGVCPRQPTKKSRRKKHATKG